MQQTINTPPVSPHSSPLKYLLVINHAATTVEIGIFASQKNPQLMTPQLLTNSITLHYHTASAQLIPAIDRLLAELGITLSDLDACAVNAGPGPFTTLRTVVATVNGLAYALQADSRKDQQKPLPLIAVDGVEAFLHEHYDQKYAHTIATLNAFGNDHYIACLNHSTGEISTCVQRKESTTLETTATKHIGLHAPEGPQSVSLAGVATAAARHWRDGTNISTKIVPSYFKPYVPGT